MISLNRSPDWDSRSPYLFLLSSLPQMLDGLRDCLNEVGYLAGSQFVMTDVFADDFGGEMQLVSIGVHEGISDKRVYVDI